MGNKYFIRDILQFDYNEVNATRLKRIKRFLKDKDRTLSFEQVNKASRVAGAFVLWINIQMKLVHLQKLFVKVMRAEFAVSGYIRLYADKPIPSVIQEQMFRFLSISFHALTSPDTFCGN